MKLPLREIYRQYTKSEMAVMAWRSSETVYNLSRGRNQSHQAQGNGQELPFQGRNYAIPDKEFQHIEDALGESIVTAMVNEDGDVDLRRLSGDQALHYMRTMGFPIAPGLVRNSVNDPVVDAYRRAEKHNG